MSQAIEMAWQDFKENEFPDNMTPSMFKSSAELLTEFKHTFFAAFQAGLKTKGVLPATGGNVEIAYKNGTAFVVESVGTPSRIHRGGMYPFNQMELGDSFKIDPASVEPGDEFDKMLKRISVAATYWNNENKKGKTRLSIRKRRLESGNVEHRCYMVKREENE